MTSRGRSLRADLAAFSRTGSSFVINGPASLPSFFVIEVLRLIFNVFTATTVLLR